MKTYLVRQSSPGLWILSFMLTIIFGMGILIFLAINLNLPKGTLFSIILFAPVIFLAFKLPRYTATVDIEFFIDEFGLRKKWCRQFIFQNRPEWNIKWTDIQDYVFEPDRQFDKFKLTLKDGRRLKIFHNNDYNEKDEFMTFLTDFKLKVSEINSDSDPANDIVKGKTIYETGWGLVLATFSILIIVGLPIMLIFFPGTNKLNYAGLGTAYVGAIFYLMMVVIHRFGENKSKATANTGLKQQRGEGSI